MPLSDKHTSDFTSSRHVPTMAEVDRIAALTTPVLRNLQITQCYFQLSAVFAARIGAGANWCTFATWASKQAGQTIRREDLLRALETLLKTKLEIGQAVSVIAAIAKELGAKPSIEYIRQSVWMSLVTAVVDGAGDAVSRGNKKVFEEIGREFARFTATCLNDSGYEAARIKAFCQSLRPGDPPTGQRYLRQAFTRYYEALFETDAKKRAELMLLANLEIGFHEQTRLQPEIAESLDAAQIDPQQVKKRLLAIIFPDGGYMDQIKLFFLDLFRKTAVLDKTIESLVSLARHQIRAALTAHLMTLTLPPDRRLRLGQDLIAVFPDALKELANPDLRTLLAHIDPTPDSLRETGSIDWADLPERLHFIADLFRCYHESADLMASAFTAEQVVAMKAGKVPGGRL
ncbi:hypothetical protein GCM10023189_00050 [Nibrella saemangeumensis]|uniref:Uncharacterized protein n=1 Tax=Nibrella saemangeumensis TaxID=1084526 RepID=A0ABP8M8M3_9BACT